MGGEGAGEHVTAFPELYATAADPDVNTTVGAWRGSLAATVSVTTLLTVEPVLEVVTWQQSTTVV